MSTTTMHAYTVPESLIPGHLHPNTQRKYREVLRKFQVTRETTWPDVLAAVNAVANINTRRTCIMVLRQVLGRDGAPAVPRSIRRTYELPSAEEIVERSAGKYQYLALVTAFAGLRLSEAVALRAREPHTPDTTTRETFFHGSVRPKRPSRLGVYDDRSGSIARHSPLRGAGQSGLLHSETVELRKRLVLALHLRGFRPNGAGALLLALHRHPPR